MRVRSLRRQLWVAGTALWSIAASLIVWGLFGSSERFVDELAEVAPRDRLVSASSATSPSPPGLERFAQVWSRPMQKPLYDPPPKPEPPSPPPPPPKPLNIRLLGTMLESDRPAAMFTSSRGGIFIREVGQTVSNDPGEATVVRIEANKVVVEFDGGERVLTLGDAR